MFGYNLELAWHGLRRFPRSTVLVVLTVALGLAACMTTLTLLHVLTADPLPGRSQHIYQAWVDTVQGKAFTTSADMAMNGVSASSGYQRIKLGDAQALLAKHRATRQVVTADMISDVASADGKHVQGSQVILATSSDFVPMFGVPMRYGRNWSVAEEAARTPVVLIDTDLAQKLFATENAVGRRVRLGRTLFQVVGVFAPYAPQPHFYGLDVAAFTGDGGENLYLPYTAALDAGLSPLTADRCDASYKASPGGMPSDPAHCASLGFWVQLDKPAQVAGYRAFLIHYVEQQKVLAGFAKPARAELTSVAAWLKQQDVVPDSVRLNVWLAGSFLLLCMINVAGLLAARFLRRSGEIGIRRALGAPRLAVFLQHVLEAGGACLAGGLVAIPLTWLGVWTLRQQGNDFSGLVHLDPLMFGVLFALALAVGMLVGILPAWRASAVEPGLQVKSE
ncbi:MAG TPA: ABC transporter permease [Rhodanobacter sp.]|nr:ABC transporter permease [Rhodanobacter sp.]